MDQVHRPQADRHEGEDGRGKDHLFLSKYDRSTTEATFPVMSENGAEARLVCACGASRPTDRTRLNEMRAVRNPVCNTPKASSANAERIEQASQKVGKRSRTSRSWFEGLSVENAK